MRSFLSGLVYLLRQFDPSFMVTLAVLAVLGASLYVFANVSRELADPSQGSRWIALVNGDLEALNTTPAVRATPTLTAPVAIATPTVSVTVVLPTATPALAPATATTIPATVTPVPSFGQVRQFTGGGVILREQPNRNSPPVGTIASGERVEILASVPGEVVEAGETTWYRVRYRNIVGFIYSRLIDRLP